MADSGNSGLKASKIRHSWRSEVTNDTRTPNRETVPERPAKQSPLNGFEWREPAIVERSEESVRLALARFFEDEDRGAATRRAYAGVWNAFSSTCVAIGASTIADVTTAIVDAHLEEMRARGCSTSTIDQTLSAIRSAMGYLLRAGVLDRNPAKDASARGGTPPRQSDDGLTHADVERLMESLQGSETIDARDAAIVAVAVHAFARVGTIVKMRRRDFEDGGNRTMVVLTDTDGSRRRIPCHPRLEKSLRVHVANDPKGDPNGRLFSPSDPKGRIKTDEALWPESVNQMLRRRARKAGIATRITCDGLRAVGLKAFLSSGGRVEVAATAANHKSLRSTQRFMAGDATIEDGAMDSLDLRGNG